MGRHKVGYRAQRGPERGVLYKDAKGEEIFRTCKEFMQDVMTGPCIVLDYDMEDNCLQS